MRGEDWIGRQLRRVYKDVLDEPIPDQFASLLTQIGESDLPDRDGAD